MPFARRQRVDLYLSAAGGAQCLSAARHKIFSSATAAARRPEAPYPNFTLSVQYIFTVLLSISLPFTLLFNRQTEASIGQI
jgi:hypothetical protein